MIDLSAGSVSGLEGMEIRHQPALGDGYLFTYMFEGVGGASFKYPWDSLHPRYGWQPSGSFGYQMECPGDSEHPLRITVGARPASEDQLCLSASLANLSDRTYGHCWADMCLMFRFTPPFADRSGERCILDTDAGLVAASRWPRRVRQGSWSPLVQAYRVAGMDLPYPGGVVQGLAMWSVAPTAVKSGCIMMQRMDGCWCAGLAWDRVASVAHNPDDDHHCIHSDPWFGTIAPRGEVVRRGLLLFVQGSPEAWLRRYQAWLEE